MLETTLLHTKFELESLRRFVSEQVIATSRVCDKSGDFPLETYQALHKMGWIQAFIPEKFGGLGARTTDMAFIYREIAYGSGGVFSSCVVNLLALSPIILYASPKLAEKLCLEFQNEFSLFSYAMTEPNTGSNISKLQTRAKRVKGGYILNGAKCFITNAGYSKHLVTFARIEGSDPDKPSITGFYLPANSPGVTRGAHLDKMGQKDSNTGELYFENVFVPEENRIGEEGQGLRIAFHCLQRSKAMIAAAGVGTCSRASDLVIEYLHQRELYSEPLIELPGIQHQLARMHVELRASWLLTCDAASSWDSGQFSVLESSVAKLFSARTTVNFISQALELFGGYGYSKEFEIEKLYRDAKIFEIYEGPTLVQEQLVFRELFLRGKEKSSRSSEKKAA